MYTYYYINGWCIRTIYPGIEIDDFALINKEIGFFLFVDPPGAVPGIEPVLFHEVDALLVNDPDSLFEARRQGIDDPGLHVAGKVSLLLQVFQPVGKLMLHLIELHDGVCDHAGIIVVDGLENDNAIKGATIARNR